jgi:hypothetical protein
VTTVTAARAGGEADAMRFSRLFVVAVLVDLGVSGIAAASGSAHRQGRMLALPAAQQICPSDPAVPLVEPEAREVMNVGAAQQIANGTGIKVGIIADGIDVNLPDLIRTGGQHVVFDYQDFSGFGTGAPTDGRQAFLAAGIIASQGRQTYDLSGFVNPAHPLPPGCNIRIQGIAPGSSLAVLNVAGSNPRALNSQIAEAIRYAVNVDQVDVLDEPFVANPIPDTQDDPVSLANQAAVTAGVTVVVGSGDAGPFDDIGAPATSAGVISVGGTTTYRLYRQTTRYGTQLSSGGWENDNISALGSSGITAFNPGTVSVVAPADNGWSCVVTTRRRSSVVRTSTVVPVRSRSSERIAPARRPPRPRRRRRSYSRHTRRRTPGPCHPQRWSSGSSSAQPPTSARPPSTRAPGWSTRSRPSSWSSPSVPPAGRAAPCWSASRP